MSDIPSPEQSSVTPGSPLQPVGWAAFLACSWTWCIGMFLPVLLVRDYGFWAWVVFAVPNVVGAAAMGWVMRDADASRKFVASHRPACAAFSWVTVAFHLFFAAWILTRFGTGTTMAVSLLATTALCWIAIVKQRTALLAAAILLGASVVLMMLTSSLRMPAIKPPSLQVLYLSSACVLGFSLCPYLDLTFHRARQMTTPAGGRVAFGLGFGLFFCAMIVFTLLYADVMNNVLAGVRIAPTLIGVHLVLQSGFTIAVHLSQLGSAEIRVAPISIPGVIFCAAAIGLGFAPFAYRCMDGGEIVYRCFMAFYGLLFPAYVWICGWPLGASRKPDARSLILCALAILVAAPGFWLGFIERKMIFVVPAVAVVLIAGFIAHQRPRSADPAV